MVSTERLKIFTPRSNERVPIEAERQPTAVGTSAGLILCDGLRPWTSYQDGPHFQFIPRSADVLFRPSCLRALVLPLLRRDA